MQKQRTGNNICLQCYRFLMIYSSTCVQTWPSFLCNIQPLPVEFQILLSQHDDTTITFRHGLQRWTISVRNSCFEEGWIEYCHQNMTKEHDMLLLRHAGDLIFDIIHFCELKKQVYLRWTVSLPNLLHQQSSIGSQVIFPFLI